MNDSPTTDLICAHDLAEVCPGLDLMVDYRSAGSRGDGAELEEDQGDLWQSPGFYFDLDFIWRKF